MLARVHTPSALVRERERERERKKESEWGERGREKREKGRERCRICPELLFLFLK